MAMLHTDCSETNQGAAYGHNEEHICVVNREYDISKLDDELSDSSVAMKGPHIENQMDSFSLRESAEMILYSSGTVSRPVDEMAIQIFVEPGTKDRQCRAYVKDKGRQCVRTAIGNNIYCCAHFSNKKERRLKVITPICGGTTVAGNSCKYHSRPGFSFCKRHWHKAETGQTSNSNRRTLKRKAEENCSGSQNLICKDLVLAHPESPLEINPVSVINDVDPFFAKNILGGETLKLCGNDHNEDSCIDNENAVKEILGSSRKGLVLCNDISSGKESTPVICVVDLQVLNYICEQEQERYVYLPKPWEMFTYVTKPMLDRLPSLDYEDLQLYCDCLSSTCCPEMCDHVYLFDDEKDIFGKPMAGRFAYDVNGRIILEEGSIVFECNDKCGCNKTCPNRILQNGVRVKLEVFITEKKGFGVRAGEAILRGTFVCEYIGEVLEQQEAHNRRGSKENCSYFFDIDARANHMSRLVEGHPRYVIDSTTYGNVSRFINNSCSPNLVDYKVFVEGTDCKHTHIGLYASRDIALGEELTYNYDYELVPGEGSPCLCGSLKC